MDNRVEEFDGRVSINDSVITDIVEDTSESIECDSNTFGGVDSNTYTSVVGQQFCSYKDAKNMYFKYDVKMRFSMRKGTTKVRNGKMILHRFVCFREGNCHSQKSGTPPTKKKFRKI